MKQNVDKNGDYVKYSKLENQYDGLACMYEGLTELEDGLIDLIQLVKDNKSKVARKLSKGEFDITENDKDTLCYDVPDIGTYINQWLSGYNDTIQRGHDDFFFSDEEPKSPLSAVGELPEEKLLQYFESMISARYSVETGFYDYKFSDSLARYAVSGDSLIALSVSDSKDLATEFAQLVREILKKETFSTVRIFVQCDLDEHYTDLMELQCSVHKLPQEFVV